MIRAIDKPDGLPVNPEVAYVEDWIGWHEFLGSNYKKAG